MRKSIVLGVSLLALAAAGSGTAFAQSDSCKGKLVVNNVYPEGGKYKVQVQNQTGQKMTGELTFGGFPHGVKTVSRVAVTLGGNQNERYVFATSTDTSFNNGNVDFVVDRDGAPSKPAFIRITSCHVVK